MITERESGSSLFERISEAVNPPPRQRPKAALLHSVRNNLCNILNTRSGSCYGSPELGIPDFNDESWRLKISGWRQPGLSGHVSCAMSHGLPTLLLPPGHRTNMRHLNCVFILWRIWIFTAAGTFWNLTFCWITISTGRWRGRDAV